MSIAVQKDALASPGPNGMAHVPGGVFRMGSDRHYSEEAPSHLAKVDGFWIDRTPVTNREFRKFVNATGYVTFAAEALGGSLLILGVQTRWIAIALTPALFGAIIWVHGANGWVFTAPNGGWEYPAFLLIASVVQFLLGDGAYALAPSTANPRASSAAA